MKGSLALLKSFRLLRGQRKTNPVTTTHLQKHKTTGNTCNNSIQRSWSWNVSCIFSLRSADVFPVVTFFWRERSDDRKYIWASQAKYAWDIPTSWPPWRQELKAKIRFVQAKFMVPYTLGYIIYPLERKEGKPVLLKQTLRSRFTVHSTQASQVWIPSWKQALITA